MKKITKEHIILLHEQLIQETGGSRGVRDYNLLDSAVEAPFSSFAGVSPYPTIESKATRLGYGLIKNHPFIDGNKRIGILAMLVFLELNGIEIYSSDEELINLGLNLASGKITDKELLQWIISHN